MRDASGQMYMRNRYYDPATSQFTQADPIGLAGGLNAFGFANRDPVTYSDPYGLAAYDDDCTKVTSKACPLVLPTVTVRPWSPQDMIDEMNTDGSFDRVLGTIGAGGGRAGALRGVIRRFFGRANPTKLNRGGIPQPYNAADGRYLPYDANPGLLRGPAGELVKGAGEGGLDAVSQGPPNADVPPSLPRAVGRVVGNALAKLFGA